MADAIDFYFDFSSPYGYFAASRIEALAAKHDRNVDWHPVLLGAVFKTTGGMPLSAIPMKGDYSFHDFERTARFHRIPYNRPSAFPLPTQAAARAMLWVRTTLGDAKAVEFAKAVYRAYFVDGVNIGEPSAVAQIGSGIGIDPAALTEGLNSEPIKDKLKADVAQAMARGVFGSPFMIVDGESFWGFDRFDQLDAFLKNGKI
ncbi:MAG: 2-hydroxychromene-2-carboxylate isomerase [Herminiimonas sp.]|jgi:2-hydroxychromene-2-carboxylate isomerase|nr:2-hydroxychromene-2-carboxylate isomerase [Herminiimonas sp.]